MNIIEAFCDRNVFAPQFAKGDWFACRVFLKVLFNLPLTDVELELFRRCTGRTKHPNRAFRRAFLAVGRRGGKSRILALIAVYLAAFTDWKPYLAGGETGVIMVIAQNRDNARIILEYVRDLINSVPMLLEIRTNETNDSVTLRNKIRIEVHTCSFRSVRGFTIIAALLDEIAMWPDEDAASPDVEVLAALRPAMLTIPNAMLLAASSPYAKRGALYETYSKHFGNDSSDVLIWQAPTRTMHPDVPQEEIDAALAEDPARFSAEYMAEFRTDCEVFLPREAVEACVAQGTYERPPFTYTHQYAAFVDPSGGGPDSMTLCIGHREENVVVIDCLREVTPPIGGTFSPEHACSEFAQVLKSYHCHKVVGDNFAGEWPKEQFRKYGITYEPSKQPKSVLYTTLLPQINSRRVVLLDHARLFHQLTSLERHTARGGRDKIDHPQRSGAHDDLANCVAGLVAQYVVDEYGGYDWRNFAPDPGTPEAEELNAWWRSQQYWGRYGVYR
jgi:hypothetical protein